ncbi:MAG: replication factor C large subunit [Candidatus Norongarragalinales archaeon]
MPSSAKTSELWIVKHAPCSIGEVAGNEEARETIKKWALDWRRGKRGKPLLIWGPTGSGKTALVRALALEMNWALSESNASSDRGTGDFVKRVLPCAESACDLYGMRRLLFVDEVDAVFDRAARSEGGKTIAAALAPVLEKRAFPIILAAENAWEPRLAPLRQYCLLIEFKRVNWRAIAATLAKIAFDEGFKNFKQEEFEALAQRAGGDLRAAINDLQVACAIGEVEADAAFGNRDRQERVFETLRAIFHARSFDDAVRASEASEADLDLLLRWLEENIPREFAEKEDGGARERANAFDALSKASVFEARIRRSQNWTLLKYARALACGGIATASARGGGKPHFIQYSFPTVLKALGESKKNRALLAGILAKIMASLHCSRKQALETVVFLRRAPGFASFFELSSEEVELLSSFD